jgi:hypothetical protein
MIASRTLAVVVLALVLGSTMALMAADPPAIQPAAAGKVRIGTYDNRAVAVAYAASRFNPVREKMAEHEAAKRAGDKEKLKALEAWGEEHQRMLHVQGFCRVPVTELLEPVSEKLRALLKEQNLAAIVMSCDVAAPDVELVDVTAQVVELFEPSAKTKEMAQKVRGAKPASLLDVAAAPARH